MQGTYKHRIKLARFCKDSEVEPLLPESFQRSHFGLQSSLSSKGTRSPARHLSSRRFSMRATMFYSGKAYCRPECIPLHPTVVLTRCELALVFIAAIFAAFPSMYITDALVPLSTYLPYYYKGITDSSIGWLTSISFLPSLFVTILMAPLIDRFGPVAMGTFCCTWFVAISVCMPFVQQYFSGLLVTRLLFGLFSESSWIVQASLIAKYMQPHLESFGFGLCMSISTSAALLSFVTIPPLFSSLDLAAIEGVGPEAAAELTKLEQRIIISYWISVAVAGLSLVVFLVCSLPLLRVDRRSRAAHGAFRHSIAYMPSLPSYMDVSILPKLPKAPNRATHAFLVKQLFNLPPDFWFINFSFSILLAVCETCQTLLLAFIQVTSEEITSHRAEYFGVVRTLFTVLFGPLCGMLVPVIGRRPLLACIVYIASTLAFCLIMVLPAWYNMVPMAVIGIADGSSAAFLKSLFSKVVGSSQLNAAYAISESLLNVFQFAFPPVAGLVSDLFRGESGKSYGAPFTFAMLLSFGMLLSFVILNRDRAVFRGKLSSRT